MKLHYNPGTWTYRSWFLSPSLAPWPFCSPVWPARFSLGGEGTRSKIV